jgi:hypothetical protein
MFGALAGFAQRGEPFRELDHGLKAQAGARAGAEASNKSMGVG